jgi:predicted nucleic acid-binding protein
VTLTDAGPLIALINRNDPNHSLCVAALANFAAGPMRTTWPCFTEAMYLLHRAGGFAAQAELWRLVSASRLIIHDLNAAEIDRTAQLMASYKDRPMDLADATLVALAESSSCRELFTLDNDFHIYRLADGGVITIVP